MYMYSCVQAFQLVVMLVSDSNTKNILNYLFLLHPGYGYVHLHAWISLAVHFYNNNMIFLFLSKYYLMCIHLIKKLFNYHINIQWLITIMHGQCT